MATAHVDWVIVTDKIEKAVKALEGAGFRAESFECSINLKGHSDVSIQIRTESVHQGFPERALRTRTTGQNRIRLMAFRISKPASGRPDRLFAQALPFAATRDDFLRT